ncbi:hypothetical protein QE152_g35263 [Popillia japonica]|uniref:Uncharacterized protein n=1 Tax=Popillia japonica TaxID=7064 RepID=A0AAW1IGE7_POPJA
MWQTRSRTDCPEQEKKYVRNLNTVGKEEEEISFLTQVEMSEMTASMNAPLTSVGNTEIREVQMSAVSDVSEYATLSFKVDYGATHHLINKNTGKYLAKRHPVNHKIKVAKKGADIVTVRNGNLYVQHEITNIKINGVLECTELEYKLLSVKSLRRKD